MKKLDVREGVPNHYERHTVSVFLDSGEEVEATTYIAHAERVREGLKPVPSYYAHILDGARHHQLPPHYIMMIEGLE